jgi:hypothetical protein
MRCFGGMNKESGGPGGSHCGRNLAGNMAAFSDTRDDDAAAAGEERLHGPDEVISDAVRKSRYRGGFNFQNFLCQRENPLGLGSVLVHVVTGLCSRFLSC